MTEPVCSECTFCPDGAMECDPERAGCPFSAESLLALQAELDELERTDPEVGAAVRSYDDMVRRLTGRSHD